MPSRPIEEGRWHEQILELLPKRDLSISQYSKRERWGRICQIGHWDASFLGNYCGKDLRWVVSKGEVPKKSPLLSGE